MQRPMRVPAHPKVLEEMRRRGVEWRSGLCPSVWGMTRWINHLTGRGLVLHIGAVPYGDGWVEFSSATVAQKTAFLMAHKRRKALHQRRYQSVQGEAAIIETPVVAYSQLSGLDDYLVPSQVAYSRLDDYLRPSPLAPGVAGLGAGKLAPGVAGLGFDWGSLNPLNILGPSDASLINRLNETRAKFKKLVDDIFNARNTNSLIKKMYGTYQSAASMTLRQLIASGVADPAVRIKAGGDSKSNVIKELDEADRVYDRLRKMVDADLQDPSGKTGDAVTQEYYGAAIADSLRREQSAKTWEAITDIKNPFSPLSILEGIKKYAIWILIGGGVLLAAPFIMKAVGGGIRGYKAGRGEVSANRRRR